MNLAHVHLILTHVPIAGTVIAGILFGVAVRWRNVQFQRLALAFLLVFALVTIPVYFSGESAEDTVKRVPGVLKTAIESHEHAATAAFVTMEALGGLALLGLAVFWWSSTLPSAFTAIVLVAVLSVTGLFTWTGYLGGQIRHSEIRPAASADLAQSETVRRPHHEDD